MNEGEREIKIQSGLLKERMDDEWMNEWMKGKKKEKNVMKVVGGFIKGEKAWREKERNVLRMSGDGSGSSSRSGSGGEVSTSSL